MTTTPQTAFVQVLSETGKQFKQASVALLDNVAHWTDPSDHNKLKIFCLLSLAAAACLAAKHAVGSNGALGCLLTAGAIAGSLGMTTTLSIVLGNIAGDMATRGSNNRITSAPQPTLG